VHNTSEVNSRIRIIFMGTPGFAVPSLRALIESDDDVVAVVTRQDKPQGRGRRIIPTPVKVVAKEYSIPVLQPAKIKTDEFYEELKSLKPELICVAAYGKILPKNVLDLPPQRLYQCSWIHTSKIQRGRAHKLGYYKRRNNHWYYHYANG